MPRPPVYSRIVVELRNRITSGIYSPGERLPPVRELCPEFDVSPGTMQKALAEIRAQGLLESRRGFGWSVKARTGGSAVTDTHLIMPLNSDERDRTYPRILLYNLIEQHVASHGARLLHQRPQRGMTSADLFRWIADSPASHCVVCTSVLRYFDVRQDFWILLAELPKRVVWIELGISQHRMPFDQVTFDWLSGTDAAVDMLVHNGCERLYFAGYDGEGWSDERRGGFLRALRRHGLWRLGEPEPCLQPPSKLERSSSPNKATAAIIAEELHKQMEREPVDGLICANDFIAEALLNCTGIDRLPRLVGYDNTFWAADHGISSVTINGRRAVDDIFHLLALPRATPPRLVAVPTMLIER